MKSLIIQSNPPLGMCKSVNSSRKKIEFKPLPFPCPWVQRWIMHLCTEKVSDFLWQKCALITVSRMIIRPSNSVHSLKTMICLPVFSRKIEILYITTQFVDKTLNDVQGWQGKVSSLNALLRLYPWSLQQQHDPRGCSTTCRRRMRRRTIHSPVWRLSRLSSNNTVTSTMYYVRLNK